MRIRCSVTHSRSKHERMSLNHPVLFTSKVSTDNLPKPKNQAVDHLGFSSVITQLRVVEDVSISLEALWKGY
jgi:hypothetical protein